MTAATAKFHRQTAAGFAAFLAIVGAIIGTSPVQSWASSILSPSAARSNAVKAETQARHHGLIQPTPIPVGWIGRTIGYGSNRIVSYDQNDPKYRAVPIGTSGDNIWSGGCGLTAMGMVAATELHDPSITPVTITRRYGGNSTYYTAAVGTHWAVFPQFAKDYHLHYQALGTDLGAVAAVIARGGLVIASFQSNGHKFSYFTRAGHLMVIRGENTQSGNFYFADPAGDGVVHSGTEETGFTSKFLLSKGNNKGRLAGLFAFWVTA